MDWRSPFDGDLAPSRVLAGGVALFLALALVVGAVQVLGDPGPPQSAEVDPSESPGEVAVDALRNASATSHTAVVRFVDPDGSDGVYVWWYDPGDEQFAAPSLVQDSPLENPEPGTYVTENAHWSRHPTDGNWERLGDSHDTFGEATPLYDPALVADAPVSVVRENATTLVLRADLTADGSIDRTSILDRRALTIVVDRERRRPVRFVADEQGDRGRIVVELTEYGTTDVQRPDGVPRFSPESLWHDATHGPLFG